jgi:hypothetical protein
LFEPPLLGPLPSFLFLFATFVAVTSNAPKGY